MRHVSSALKILGLGSFCLLLSSTTEAGNKAPDCASTTGTVSYYGGSFIGRKTASGEVFTAKGMTAAHKTLPFGTRLKLTNLKNGRSVQVVINDRGPYVKGRLLDLSAAAAHRLGFVEDGLAQVKIESCARR